MALPTTGRSLVNGTDPVVVKFGGSSLARREQITEIASRIADQQAAGRSLVIVVSARGRQTDRLRRLADALANSPPARELDLLLSSGEQVSAALLSMAVGEAGGRARALTAAQAGIVTDGAFGRASVREISRGTLEALLDQGVLPIVAGFQGVTPAGEVTTLGRGGSDTTAVAVAAALGWKCEIRTDVAGVFTADPREVEAARLRPVVLYDEMSTLSLFGARVLHWAAADLARRERVPLAIRHSLDRTRRTRLVAHVRTGAAAVTAIASCGRRLELRFEGVSRRAARRIIETAGPGAIAVWKGVESGRLVVPEEAAEAVLGEWQIAVELAGPPAPTALVSIVGPEAGGPMSLAALSAARSRDGIDCAPLEIVANRLTVRVPPADRSRLVVALHRRLERAGALDAAVSSKRRVS